MVVLLSFVGLAAGLVLGELVEASPDLVTGGRRIGQCPSCEAPRGAASLVPLSGCRSCTLRLSPSRCFAGVLSAAGFGIATAVIGVKLELLPVVVLVGCVSALAAVDVVRCRLPNRAVAASIGVSLLAITVTTIGVGSTNDLYRALFGASVFATAMFAFAMVGGRGGIGMGDVKLSVLLGLNLGWVASSWGSAAQMILWGFILGCVLGLVTGGSLAICRAVFGSAAVADPERIDQSNTSLMTTTFPFAPALSSATVALVVASSYLLGGTGVL